MRRGFFPSLLHCGLGLGEKEMAIVPCSTYAQNLPSFNEAENIRCSATLKRPFMTLLLCPLL